MSILITVLQWIAPPCLWISLFWLYYFESQQKYRIGMFCFSTLFPAVGMYLWELCIYLTIIQIERGKKSYNFSDLLQTTTHVYHPYFQNNQKNTMWLKRTYYKVLFILHFTLTDQAQSIFKSYVLFNKYHVHATKSKKIINIRKNKKRIFKL